MPDSHKKGKIDIIFHFLSFTLCLFRVWAKEAYEFYTYDFNTELNQLIVKIPEDTRKNGIPVSSNISFLVNRNRQSLLIGDNEVYEYHPSLVQFVHKTTLDANYSYKYFHDNTIIGIGMYYNHVALFTYPDGKKINEFTTEESSELFCLSKTSDRLFIVGGDPSIITMFNSDGTFIKNIEDERSSHIKIRYRKFSDTPYGRYEITRKL